MTNKNLEKLNQVVLTLSLVNDINRGGCGIAALAIKRWVEKNIPVKNCEIRFLYRKDDGFRFNESILNGSVKRKKPIAPSHCVLKIDGRIFDTSCLFFKVDAVHVVTEDFLIKTINHKSSWNGIFSRERVKDIEELLKISLVDVST